MPQIQLENVWKSYGANTVLRGVTWNLEPGVRIGLVGRNGCGKTTLFHVLTGTLLPEQGSVHRQRGVSVGYLSQDPTLEREATVYQTAQEGFQHLLDLQGRLRELESRMASGQNDPGLLEEYGRLRDRYETEGGYALEARTKSILYGLGFGEQDLDLRVSQLSGGQKNRLALAKLLADRPDLLLLDEPTNHLDLQAIEWLESFLAGYDGAFVLISHDRYFLDRTVGRIVELEAGQIEHFAGNYTFYAAEKERRRTQQQKAYEEQQAHIARTEEYIRRNLAGQKTRQAQSRRKALEKLERLDRPSAHRDIALAFRADARGGDRVLEVEGLAKAYGDRTLFENLNLALMRGDRMGVVGPNGCGKSTLLKLIMGQVVADAGRIALGRGIRIGYYDQARQDLNPDGTVLEEVWSVTPQASLGEVRSFLGGFLFSGDDVERTVGNLSGGEQSRIALAKLMRSHVNLLVLDEPTNHLDLPSRVVLERALEQFDGSLLAVSHDRYFLNRVVDRLLVLGSGAWQLVDGTYRDWQQRLAEAGQERAEDPDKTARKAAYEKNRRTQRVQERRVRRIAEIEAEIARLEGEIGRLDQDMAREDMARDWAQLQERAKERDRLQSRIDERFKEWEDLEAAARTE